MNTETLVFGLFPAILLLSAFIAFMKTRRIRSGLGLMILLLPVLLVVGVILALAYCEINKAYWDHRVREMCMKDGGVTVYEKVLLDKSEYEAYGGIRGAILVPNEDSKSAKDSRYLARRNSSVIKLEYPTVTRFESTIYRPDDKKELGKMVTYYRSGGDFPTIVSSGTSFSCADISGIDLNIENHVFSIKEN